MDAFSTDGNTFSQNDATPPGNQPVKVAIADCWHIFMQGLGSVIDEHPSTELCAFFLNGRLLVDWYNGANADVILIDISQPASRGMEACTVLCSSFPDAKIVALATGDDAAEREQLRKLGICGWLFKDVTPDTLLETIFKVHAGEKVFPESPPEKPAGYLPVALWVKSNPLTECETQVLKLVAKGQTSSQIADKLSINVKTVYKHREIIRKKMAVHSVAELITVAGLCGLLLDQ